MYYENSLCILCTLVKSILYIYRKKVIIKYPYTRDTLFEFVHFRKGGKLRNRIRVCVYIPCLPVDIKTNDSAAAEKYVKRASVVLDICCSRRRRCRRPRRLLRAATRHLHNYYPGGSASASSAARLLRYSTATVRERERESGDT